MNLVYKYGQGGNEAVLYERARADGLVHKIRNKYGSEIMIHDSNLHLLDQTDLLNITSTPIDYRKEVGKGLSYPLYPLQKELTSWHHRLYHLPFNNIFLLARDSRLLKKLLK